jgi:hypothetical protein
MGKCVFQFRFEGPMFGHQFSEMRLKAHAFLHSSLGNINMMT